MRLSHFFIDRPILASVPSILVTLLGLAAGFSLRVTRQARWMRLARRRRPTRLLKGRPCWRWN